MPRRIIINKRTALISYLLLLELFLLATCGQAQKVPLVGGRWTVIGHTAPGIAAMGREQADTWIGKTAEYTNQRASFNGTECAAPTYRSRAMRPDEFYSGFRVAPQSLGAADGSIELIEVSCGNRGWTNPGSTLIRIGDDKLYLFWDGVFFQLQERQEKSR
jgi:hypothetical protein